MCCVGAYLRKEAGCRLSEIEMGRLLMTTLIMMRRKVCLGDCADTGASALPTISNIIE